MYRITRLIPRPILFVLLPLFLVACGSDEDSINSSAVYGSHSVIVVQSSTKSFGANGYGQLGNGTAVDSWLPVTVTGTFSTVSIGGSHSVALDTTAGSGNVWTWGLNTSGQLGNGNFETKTSPVPVALPSGVSRFTAIAAGGYHTLAIDADGNVWAWGLNSFGQLGNNDSTLAPKNSPVQVLASDGVTVTTLSGITAISAGGAFNLALKNDGTVWAWGNNGNGQLGINNGLVTTSSVAVQVLTSGGTPLTGITAIAAGGSHALALDGTGKIYAWGYNKFGQLGNSSTISSSFAIPIVTSGAVKAISAGLDHSLAIVGDALAVYAWGYNYYGQIGNDAELLSTTANTTPQAVVDQNRIPLTNIISIVAVGDHCIAEDESGNIWTWGNNTYGQLGDGTTQSRSTAKTLVN